MTCDGERTRCFAQTCHAGGCGGSRGWRRGYRLVDGGVEAFVCLYVIDQSNPEGVRYSAFLPFLVDTGTAVTIIPRQILRDRAAFMQHCRAGTPNHVSGLGGGRLSGFMFRAALSITPFRDDCEPLTVVSDADVLVTDDRRLEHGLLGLKALRQVVSTFDGTGVSFHRPSRE